MIIDAVASNRMCSATSDFSDNGGAFEIPR